MRDISWFGTGLRTFGYEREPPEFVYVTQWLAVLYLPLIPLRRAKCRYTGEPIPDFISMQTYRDSILTFEVIERNSLSLISVVTTYIWGSIGLLAAFGPITLMIWRVANRGATPLETAIAIISATWVVGFFIWQESRRKKALEATWATERHELVRAERQRAKEWDKIHTKKSWSASHILPEWAFLGGAVLGGLISFAAALHFWGAVNGNHLQLAAIIGVASGLGLIALIDRCMVKLQRSHQNAPYDWDDVDSTRKRGRPSHDRTESPEPAIDFDPPL